MRFATFEKIESLLPIEGKDRVEIAKILDYEVVVKKEFTVGEWCVYIFIDTVVDTTRDHFKFLAKNENTTSARIKTSKIAGQFSQGLALPLSCFDNIDKFPDPNLLSEEELNELDLGPLIGVSKYEKEGNEATERVIFVKNKDGSKTKVLPGFPIHYIPITDEDNLKTKGKVLTELIGKEVDVKLKMDGSSMTAIWDDDVFILSSRRIALIKYIGDEIDFEFSSFMVDYSLEKGLRDMFRGKKIILQGEMCGPKVNGNKLKLTKFMWYIFTIYDIEERRYYTPDEIASFCKTNSFDYAPSITSFTVTEETKISDFQTIADNVKYDLPNGKQCDGEGIVVRPKIPFKSWVLGKNCSFKIINRTYKD